MKKNQKFNENNSNFILRSNFIMYIKKFYNTSNSFQKEKKMKWKELMIKPNLAKMRK